MPVPPSSVPRGVEGVGADCWPVAGVCGALPLPVPGPWGGVPAPACPSEPALLTRGMPPREGRPCSRLGVGNAATAAAPKTAAQHLGDQPYTVPWCRAIHSVVVIGKPRSTRAIAVACCLVLRYAVNIRINMQESCTRAWQPLIGHGVAAKLCCTSPTSRIAQDTG